jgi:hypothetical protein
MSFSKILARFCGASLLLTLSTFVQADTTSVFCYYDVLTGTYEYLAACSVDVGAERYEIYQRLRSAMKDFINLNSSPERPRIDSVYEETHRESARQAAAAEKCQGKIREFADVIFEGLTKEETAVKIFRKLSNPHDPYAGDCL